MFDDAKAAKHPGIPIKDAEKRPRSVAMTAAIKRACDACHRRKVKCDGVNPCRNCASSQLSCTYNAIPQKKGPKGSRAKVISELRETQRQTSLSTKVQNHISGVNSSPPSPTLAPTPGLLTSEMVKECVDFFFAHMYSTMPILHRQRLEAQAMYMDSSLDTYCLFTSLCAFIMLQPGMSIPGGDPYGIETMPGATIVSATLLLEETCRVRKAYDYLDQPSFNSLCTSYFLYCCYSGLDLHDKAWFHLREATTLVHMVAMNKEESYPQYDDIESARRRRLYWLLFVTERSFALRSQRPLSLQASINLPSVNDDPADPLAHQLANYLSLVNLFRPFDDAFVALWSKIRGECSQTLVQALRKQLREALPPYLNEPPAQMSEMPINQQWLKNLHWQLSVANGNGSENGMSYPYSLDIARDLMPMVSHFPGNLGLLSLGLLEKLYGIAYAFNEYLSMQHGPRDPFTRGPRQMLHEMLNIMTILRSGDFRLLPLLLCKMSEDLPRMVTPMLQNAPENGNLGNVDIFDGFGNAGMAQPAVYNEEYNKFGIQKPSRMEEMSNDSGSNSGSGSGNNEMASPYVSSPSITSTHNGDVPHGLPRGYNNMPDMMSPMQGNPGPSLGGQGQISHSQAQHSHQHSSQHQRQHQQVPSFHGMAIQMQSSMGPGMNQQPNVNLSTHKLGVSHGLGSAMSNGTMHGLSSPMTPMTTMNGSVIMARQQQQQLPQRPHPQQHPPQPQRTSSFAVLPQIRTIGDFHAVQRAHSDMSNLGALGINSMGPEPMDYGDLPPR